MTEHTIIQQAVRIYTALLWLYPRAHRRDYGPWMVQLFRDQCADAYRQQCGLGLLRLWGRTLWDLGITAFQEHLRLAADLGLANRPVTPLPWRYVLLAILPGLWLMAARAELIPYWGWIYVACALLGWRGWRNRRLARWAYPLAGLVVYGLPLAVLSWIFHQDGNTPLSPFGRAMMNHWMPFAFLVVSLAVMWKYRRRIRASGLTWLVVGGLLGSLAFGWMLIYIAVLIAVPAALGLVLVRRGRFYAPMFVLGLVWWFVDAILDPAYGLLIWTDVDAAVHVIAMLPALFILVLPVIGILRARTTYQQLAGLIVPPFVGVLLGVLLMELGRLLLLSNTAQGYTLTAGLVGIGCAVQIAAMLALVAVTYAQLDTDVSPQAGFQSPSS